MKSLRHEYNSKKIGFHNILYEVESFIPVFAQYLHNISSKYLSCYKGSHCANTDSSDIHLEMLLQNQISRCVKEMIIRGKAPSFISQAASIPAWLENESQVFKKVESCQYLLKRLNANLDIEVFERISSSNLGDSITILEEFAFVQFLTKYNVRELIQQVQGAAFLFEDYKKECDSITISRVASSTSLQQKMAWLFSHEYNNPSNEGQNEFEHCNYYELVIKCDDSLAYIFTENILDKYKLLFRFASKCEYTIQNLNYKRNIFNSKKVSAILHRAASLLTSFIFYFKNICFNRDFTQFLAILESVFTFITFRQKHLSI